MSFFYCICCQSRLTSDSDLYFKVNDPQMLKKIEIVKPSILKHLNKVSNNQITEKGVYIHKKCHFRANAFLKKIPGEHIYNQHENDNFILDTNLNSEENNYELNDLEEELTLGEINSEAHTSIEEKVDLSIPKGNSSHKYCFVCHAKNKKMVTLKSNPRYEILAKTNTFIVKGSRLCSSHLDEKGFVIEQDLTSIKPIGIVNFDEEGIKELIENFQLSKNSSQIFSQFSASNPIQENSLKLIGFSKHEFLYMAQYLNGEMNDSNKRTKEQALFVYLFWLRSGLSMEVKI